MIQSYHYTTAVTLQGLNYLNLRTLNCTKLTQHCLGMQHSLSIKMTQSLLDFMADYIFDSMSCLQWHQMDFVM